MEKFRMVKVPTEKRIKIRGDMCGPLNTPHLESLTDIKIMLTYDVPVVGFDASGENEVELTLENYTENAVELYNCCHLDPTTIKQQPVVEDVIPTKITVNPATLTFEHGGAAQEITVTVEPANAKFNLTVNKNDSIATVAQTEIKENVVKFNVTPVGEGNCAFTFVSENAVTVLGQCTVIVNAPAEEPVEENVEEAAQMRQATTKQKKVK